VCSGISAPGELITGAAAAAAAVQQQRSAAVMVDNVGSREHRRLSGWMSAWCDAHAVHVIEGGVGAGASEYPRAACARLSPGAVRSAQAVRGARAGMVLPLRSAARGAPALVARVGEVWAALSCSYPLD